MTIQSSHSIQVVSLCLGFVPAVLAIVVIVAARLEQRRAQSKGSAKN